MENSLQMGLKCVQNAPLANCDRKTLELALKELVSSNNKIRQELIQNHPNKEVLEKILVVKRAHHAFLKQLFDRCDFSKTLINTQDNKVYPSLRGISNKLNYSKSHLYSIKKHLREVALIKTISRRIEISPDGETRTTSDEYFFGQRILDLAELTVLARKSEKVEQDEVRIKKLLAQLEQSIQVEKSIHQRNGEKGLEKKRKMNELIDDLEEVTNFLENLKDTQQEENLKKLRKISSEFKNINQNICSENQSKRVKKQKPLLLKSDSPGMKTQPEILPLKSSHEILIINTPPPVQNSKNVISEATEKNSSNNEEEFEKIFNTYFELFGRRSSIKEKKLFKEYYLASGWTSDELLELLHLFGKDRYLKATTTSINRIFDAERVLSIVETVKNRLLKEEYDKKIIEPLGQLAALKKIFSSITDIKNWANEKIGVSSDGK